MSLISGIRGICEWNARYAPRMKDGDADRVSLSLSLSREYRLVVESLH